VVGGERRIVVKRVEVFDHGYLRLVETWGSDEAIVEAARQSTQKGFVAWGGERGDEKLLRTLYTKKHSTPFEFAGATFEVRAPICVFREWHRHRVPFGYSEASARYAPLPSLDYVPTIDRLMADTSGSNRQAGRAAGAPELERGAAEEWEAGLRRVYEACEEHYRRGLEIGVPKELARLCLTVGRYSTMRATGNLRGWLAFATLRQSPGAMEEIRTYANQIVGMLEEEFPRTLALYREIGRGP
jgi:thymidylate synthase (FAD)